MSATATPSRLSASSQAAATPNVPPPQADGTGPAEAPILFQDYFKSVGPRTYAAQVKRARNDNHFLLLTEGKRDDKTGEVRKTKLIVFSEDFQAFFEMVNQAAAFIRANPVPASVAQQRKQFWKKKDSPDGSSRR